MPLVVEAPERPPFRSTVLGELLDLRSGKVGLLITTPFKPRLDFRLFNLLTQAASTQASAATLRTFVKRIRPLLRESDHAWYWFQNVGASLPPGAHEVRSMLASGPCWSAASGLDVCTVQGRGVTIQGDGRSFTSFDTPEGTIEIRTETVEGRFAQALELLELWLERMNDDSPCTLWLVEGSATKDVERGEAWHTFDRERLDRRAPSLRQGVTSVLGKLLTQRGFRKARAVGDAVSSRGRLGDGGEVVWTRSTATGVASYVIFEPRSASSFRVVFKSHPPIKGTFACEAALGDHRGDRTFAYCGREELERQLLAAWQAFEHAGLDWLADPRRLSLDGWVDQGVRSDLREIAPAPAVSSTARREG